jgi:hypothetical protein
VREVIRSEEIRDLLDDLFEEEALAIGGLIALHPVDEEIVARLFGSLTVIRDKALKRIEAPATSNIGTANTTMQLAAPHPAVEAFLAKLGRC